MEEELRAEYQTLESEVCEVVTVVEDGFGS